MICYPKYQIRLPSGGARFRFINWTGNQEITPQTKWRLRTVFALSECEISLAYEPGEIWVDIPLTWGNNLVTVTPRSGDFDFQDDKTIAAATDYLIGYVARKPQPVPKGLSVENRFIGNLYGYMATSFR